ncbi:amidohydrolase family protein [Maribacter thermophilus]|uniref:amidohydrolase family protein n=1 Tax=Maribacter thermophilus TaxID=1197874 RepID=UPI000699B57B|nr:amidohydrolase family protein [Maribacter thermophilus]
MKYPVGIIVLAVSLLFSCKDVKEQDKTVYDVVFRESLAGTYEKWQTSDHGYKYYYTYTDRGRGPEYNEEISLSDENFITAQTVKGINYSKVAIDESFLVADGTATINNMFGTSKDDFEGGQLYFRFDGSPAVYEILAQLALKSETGKVALYPTGEAELTKKTPLELSNGDTLDLLIMKGLDLSPTYIWMQGGQMVCKIAGNLHIVRKDFSDLRLEMKKMQDSIEDQGLAEVAKDLTHAMDRVVVKNVNVFTKEGSLLPNQDVFVDGETIEAIVPTGQKTISGDVQVVDGTDKTLMPGMFDMHTHNSKFRGALYLAGGVTSVRDLANNKQLYRLRDQFENNEIIGPHIVTFCGIIDGPGPFANQRNVVETLEEGLAEIEDYKRLGYQQIKLYSSIKPEWVAPLTEKAHSLGMRVSGHIPAFMNATQAIEQGYNEIQHINMLFLNFLSDTIDTRTPLRFTMPAQYGADLDLKSREYTDFIDLLLEKDILVDPTAAIFENKFLAQLGEVSPTYGMVEDRFPVIYQRSFYAGGLPQEGEQIARYRASYDKMLDVISDLYHKGVDIVPGTDGLPGFLYHRELELYVKAGIPINEVLKLATIKSAEITGVSDSYGSIEPGKKADLIFIDGNPLEDISDIRRVEWTMKGGNLYYAKELYNSVGIDHFK